MLERLVAELGPWSWWLLGLILLAAELVMPGVFLIWIGMGAIVTGILSLLLWDSGIWNWEVQALVFAALAVASTLLGRRYLSRDDAATDEPLLNQRTASLIGRTATLQEPIVEGRGRIRLDDTSWPVKGPDLPAGTRVRVAGGHGSELAVEAVEN